MGWTFSTQWQSKEDVMNDCSRLSQEAKDEGWELLHSKLCKGGFALAYKNKNTGEMSISYHLSMYERGYGYGEKEVDPFIAWQVLPEKTVKEYMEKHGNDNYCGKTKRELYKELKRRGGAV